MTAGNIKLLYRVLNKIIVMPIRKNRYLYTISTLSLCQNSRGTEKVRVIEVYVKVVRS